MKTIAAIRTYQWGEDEEQLLASLRPVFGEDLVVVFHNRPEGLTLPLQAVDIDDAWLAENGLRHIPNWGWRCGDYFYYALRKARPDYDYYWLIEPDVYFGGPTESFFKPFEKVTADSAGFGLAAGSDALFAVSVKEVEVYRAIYALTRFSGPALDMLFTKRQEFGTRNIRPKFYANDEIFSFSYVQADPDLTSCRLEDFVPNWFEGAQFLTDPAMLVDLLQADTSSLGKEFHPAMSRKGFKRKLSKRITFRKSRFLTKMIPSLQDLSDEDVVEIAEDVGKALAKYLSEQRAPK